MNSNSCPSWAGEYGYWVVLGVIAVYHHGLGADRFRLCRGVGAGEHALRCRQQPRVAADQLRKDERGEPARLVRLVRRLDRLLPRGAIGRGAGHADRRVERSRLRSLAPRVLLWPRHRNPYTEH